VSLRCYAKCYAEAAASKRRRHWPTGLASFLVAPRDTKASRSRAGSCRPSRRGGPSQPEHQLARPTIFASIADGHEPLVVAGPV
jgi:hypothetical protein